MILPDFSTCSTIKYCTVDRCSSWREVRAFWYISSCDLDVSDRSHRNQDLDSFLFLINFQGLAGKL